MKIIKNTLQIEKFSDVPQKIIVGPQKVGLVGFPETRHGKSGLLLQFDKKKNQFSLQGHCWLLIVTHTTQKHIIRYCVYSFHGTAILECFYCPVQQE